VSYQPPPPTTGAPYPATAYQSYGYAASGYGPSAGEPKSLKGLATALTVLFPLAALVALVAAIAAFHRASVYDDFATRIFSGNDVTSADDQVRAAVTTFTIAIIAIMPVFIVWQFRHAKNAELLAGSLPLGPGWAIGGWFIPLGNYVLPQLQLYRASAASDPDASTGQRRAPGILIVWWVLFGVAGIVYGVGQALHPSNNDVTFSNFNDKLDQYVRADRLTAVGLLLMIAAAAAALLMVRNVTARQELALSRRSSSPANPQWPQGYAPQTGYGQPGYPEPAYPQPPQPQPYQQPAQPQAYPQPAQPQAYPQPAYPQPEPAEPQPATWQPPPSPAPPPPQAPPPQAPPPS
jgi:hypothetical protein